MVSLPPVYSHPFIIPSFNNLTLKWNTAKVWNITSKTRVHKTETYTLPTHSLCLFSPSSSGKARCYVVSHSTERPTDKDWRVAPGYQPTWNDSRQQPHEGSGKQLHVDDLMQPRGEGPLRWWLDPPSTEEMLAEIIYVCCSKLQFSG